MLKAKDPGKTRKVETFRHSTQLKDDKGVRLVMGLISGADCASSLFDTSGDGRRE